MKLELKHIAPYLPYGLEYHQIEINEIDELEYINSNGLVGRNSTYCGEEDHTIICSRIDEIKPILRPLSDLTKEIEIGDIKINPLIEIAKNYDIVVNEEDAFLEDNKIVWHEILEDPNDRDQPIDNECRFYFDITKSLISDDLLFQKIWEDEVLLILNNNIQPFDYQEMSQLFKWHFDVFGLIHKGLAIDINTLKQ